jgi:hypothetical protein
VAFTWDDTRILAEVQRATGRGLTAGAIFLTARVKEAASVPAPRVRVLGKRGENAGSYYYRATVRATPGAPLRKLSGQTRASFTYEVSGNRARVGTNLTTRKGFSWVAYHEAHDHRTLGFAFDRWRAEVGAIIGQAMTQ